MTGSGPIDDYEQAIADGERARAARARGGEIAAQAQARAAAAEAQRRDHWQAFTAGVAHARRTPPPENKHEDPLPPTLPVTEGRTPQIEPGDEAWLMDVTRRYDL